MKDRILFLNYVDEDSTKRLKLAGIRRYAAAAQWHVVPVSHERSNRESIPGLLSHYRPIGCICDEDATPKGFPPGLFGGIPVVYANSWSRRYDAIAGRICSDSEAVAAAAFRELSANVPAAYAVVGVPSNWEWALARIRQFAALAKTVGSPCHVFRGRRGETLDVFSARLVPWIATLELHTAIYAVNDPVARRVADAAISAGLRIPQDLTLLGTDNDPAFCETARPSLSSIQIDFERMGYLAARMLAARMKGLAERGMKGRAKHEMKGRAKHEMKGAACAANAGDPSFAPTAHTSFGGKAATLHCGNAAPPFGGAAATLHCGKAAPSLPPSAASSLQRPDGNDSVIAIGPLLAVRRESTGGRGRREPHILEAVEIIRREACDGLTVASLMERIPGSRSLFDLRFREAMGHSALEEILQVRLERTIDLLRRPGTSIGAIADFSGFGSLRALDKLFRSRFGCSLREWRRRNVQP